MHRPSLEGRRQWTGLLNIVPGASVQRWRRTTTTSATFRQPPEGRRCPTQTLTALGQAQVCISSHDFDSVDSGKCQLPWKLGMCCGI